MDSTSVEIVICMGSSCFSRGNKKVLQQIKEYLKENNLENKVIFKGSHCFNCCENGPVLRINGMLIQKLDPNNIGALLEEHFQGNVLQ